MAETFFEQTPVSSEIPVGSNDWWKEKLLDRLQTINRLERKRQESITGVAPDIDGKLAQLGNWLAESYKTNPLAIIAEKNHVPLDNECAQNLEQLKLDMDANPSKTLNAILNGDDVYGQNNGREGEIRIELWREDSNDSTLKLDLRAISGGDYTYKEITPTRGIVSGTFFSKSLGRNVATYFEILSYRRQISRGDR